MDRGCYDFFLVEKWSAQGGLLRHAHQGHLRRSTRGPGGDQWDDDGLLNL